MKSINKLALASLLALSSASLASATTLHITGSTAFRVATVTAEATALHTLTGAAVLGTYSGSSITGSNQSILTSGTFVIENNFTGSVGGLQTVSAAPATASGFPDSTATFTTPTAITLGSSTTAATGGAAGSFSTHSAVPDISLSDSSINTALAITTLTHTPTITSVGIVPFSFIKSKGAPASLTNISSAGAIALYSAGVLPASFLTGNAADTQAIYALGRDIDSGTRAIAFSETGLGAATPPVQYAPFDSTTAASNDNDTTHVVGNTGAGTAINSLNFYPAETVDGISGGLGAMGYASGGNLAKAMFATNNLVPTNTVFFVTYLGLSDDASAVGGGAVNINYNGVAESAASVENGSYTFWGNEGLAFLPGNATASSFANNLKTALNSGIDQLSSGGVAVSAMLVSRADDGNVNEPSLISAPTFPY